MQAYDPQTGYDLSYFRPNTADEALRRQGLLSPQEVFSPCKFIWSFFAKSYDYDLRSIISS